jgi:hypothetical protein
MTSKEMEKSISEIWALFKETDRLVKETAREQKKTDRQIKELGKQIGGLGGKFGSFTEGMAYPSMKRILKERFKMDVVSPHVEVHRNGTELELDLLAYGNGGIEEAYIVEVKSKVRNEDALQSVLDKLHDFSRFFPEHKGKALYGILVAVDISDYLKKKVLEAGLYLAWIRDDTFTIEVPKDFKPKRFDLGRKNEI